MLLVQKLPETSDVLHLALVGKVFKSMTALKSDMRNHPEKYNKDMEYSLIEPRPFLKVTRPETVKIEQTEMFNKKEMVKA